MKLAWRAGLLLGGACLTFLIFLVSPNVRSPTASLTQLHFRRHYPASQNETARSSTKSSHNANKRLSHTIPKIIHHLWKTEFVPRYYLKYILSWRTNHPDHEHWWWTDRTAQLFIKEKYQTFYNLYNKYYYNIQRADVIRYFLLHEYGGIYADLDIESLKNIQPFLDQFAPCIISEEPEVNSYLHFKINHTFASNAFFACRPKHPFFEFTIKNLEKSFKIYQTDLLHSTGPFFIHRMVKEYQKAYPNPEPLNRIIVASSKYIQPTYALDGGVDKDVQKTCKEVDDILSTGKGIALKDPLLFVNQARVCKRLKASNFSNTPGPDAYCDHHWSHSYHHPVKFTGEDKEGNVDIRNQLPVIDPSKRSANILP